MNSPFRLQALVCEPDDEDNWNYGIAGSWVRNCDGADRARWRSRDETDMLAGWDLS